MNPALIAVAVLSISTPGVEEESRPVSLTVSGGVSLGSYMAGFAYFLSETSKFPGSPVRLVLATGASAGAATALVALVNACLPANPDPSQDLGAKVWSHADYRKLLTTAAVTETSLLSSAPFYDGLAEVRDVLVKGLPPSCDAVVGFSTTRLEPWRIELAPGIVVPRLAEKFAVRVRGRGPGKIPILSNYNTGATTVDQPLLPFLSDGSESDLELLQDIIIASATFPFAFPPKRIRYCIRPAGEVSSSCEGREIIEGDFVDGGVFDNTPLRLAHELAASSLTRSRNGDLTWRDDQVKDRSAHEEMSVDYAYLDPFSSVYPAFEDSATDSDGLAGLVGSTLGNWIEAARARELYRLVGARETLRDRVFVTRVHYPPSGSLLGAFMGFFEHEFRRFDYFLGMYDAARFVIQREPRGGRRLSFSELLGQVGHVDGWAPFTCLVSYYEPGFEDWRARCADPELLDFRILLQVSLDRVYDQCARNPGPLSQPHFGCQAAMEGAAPPRVIGLSESENGYRRMDDETHFKHHMRLLEEYGFWFSDLGLERDESRYGRVKLRRKLLKVLVAFSDAQPSGTGGVVETASRTLVNSIAYEPPKNWTYVLVGSSSEIGASLLPFDWNESWARLNVAITIDELLAAITAETDRLIVRAAVGPELTFPGWSSPTFQPLLGIRAGYQWGVGDSFRSDACTRARSGNDGRRCSGFVLQNYAALAILERFRLQLTLSWTPNAPDFGTRETILGGAFGLQFY